MLLLLASPSSLHPLLLNIEMQYSKRTPPLFIVRPAFPLLHLLEFQSQLINYSYFYCFSPLPPRSGSYLAVPLFSVTIRFCSHSSALQLFFIERVLNVSDVIHYIIRHHNYSFHSLPLPLHRSNLLSSCKFHIKFSISPLN